jgi:aspartyl-tRNA(Asn)/glutamyl-tRNA(Gln) amidotransferase subunit B
METRLWDDDLGRSEKMRSKEEAQDYRYFPEPDLMDLAVDVAWLEAIRSELVELPQARRSRFVDQYQLSDYDASVISADRAVADYFEAVAASGIEAKQAANWVMSGVLRTIKEKRISVSEFPISPRRLADLLKIIRAGAITTTIARGVFERMLEDKREPGEIISTQGLSQISDTSELEAIIDEVFKANPKAVEDYRAGNKNTLNFLKGQVMRQTRGKANPRVIAQLLAQKLS